MQTSQVEQGDIKIWSYELGRFGNTRYSIRVAFMDDKVNQVYIGMDVIGRPLPSTRRGETHAD